LAEKRGLIKGKSELRLGYGAVYDYGAVQAELPLFYFWTESLYINSTYYVSIVLKLMSFSYIVSKLIKNRNIFK